MSRSSGRTAAPCRCGPVSARIFLVGRWAWCFWLQVTSHSSLLKPTARHILANGEYDIRMGVGYEPSTSRAENLSDAAEGRVYRRPLSHRRRHRTIGSILRNCLRRSHSERRRQQRRAGVHPDREHVAHCQRRRRSDTRQTIGNAQRPRQPRFSEQLYEYPRCRYSRVL
jgi:hypothetical protein